MHNLTKLTHYGETKKRAFDSQTHDPIACGGFVFGAAV